MLVHGSCRPLAYSCPDHGRFKSWISYTRGRKKCNNSCRRGVAIVLYIIYRLVRCYAPPRSTPPPLRVSTLRHWVMSLRGYGERVCNVGNMFSGLYCTIDDRMPRPRAVRKPTGRPADATRKRTWRDSEALALRRKELAPALRVLRPQQIEPQETSGEAKREDYKETGDGVEFSVFHPPIVLLSICIQLNICVPQGWSNRFFTRVIVICSVYSC